jgi:hypothetical protein
LQHREHHDPHGAVKSDVWSGLCREVKYLCTPFYAASLSGHLEVVKLLLERGVTVDLGMRGESPLEAATVKVNNAVVELLEKHGAIRTKEVTLFFGIPRQTYGSSRTLTGLGD